MRNLVISLSALTIILIGLIGSAVILLDEHRLNGLFAAHVERSTGRKIEVLGNLEIRLFPGLRVTAHEVVFSGPVSYSGPALLRASQMDMQVSLVSLIRGELQARDVELTGTSVNVHVDESGRSSLEGLLAAGQAGDRESAAWLQGPLALNDVMVNFTDHLGNRQEALAVDFIELDGFAVDQPLDFHFRGNVGDPPLLDWLEVDGLLVSLDSGLFRLSNMRLAGEAENGHFVLDILGNMNFHSGPPLRVAVDSERLMINEHQLRGELGFVAFDRPYLNVKFDTPELTLDTLRVPALIAQHADFGRPTGLLAGLRGMDFDLELKIARLLGSGLELRNVEIVSQAREGRVTVDQFSAEMTGAVFTALASFDLDSTGPKAHLAIRIDASDLSMLSEQLPTDLLPRGSGALALRLETRLDPTASPSVVWIGEGGIELSNGQWAVLPELVPHSLGGMVDGRFDYLTARLEFNAQVMGLHDLRIVRDAQVIEGELSVPLVSRKELTGLLQYSDQDHREQLMVSGTVRPLPADEPHGSSDR